MPRAEILRPCRVGRHNLVEGHRGQRLGQLRLLLPCTVLEGLGAARGMMNAGRYFAAAASAIRVFAIVRFPLGVSGLDARSAHAARSSTGLEKSRRNGAVEAQLQIRLWYTAHQPGVVMANKQTFVVQAFDRAGEELVLGVRDAVSSSDEALALASARAAISPGTIALSFTAGDVSSVSVLGTFGEIPDEFVEILLT